MKPEASGACSTCRHWGTRLPSSRMVKHAWAPCRLRGEFLTDLKADLTDDLTRDDDTCTRYAPREIIRVTRDDGEVYEREGSGAITDPRPIRGEPFREDPFAGDRAERLVKRMDPKNSGAQRARRPE